MSIVIGHKLKLHWKMKAFSEKINESIRLHLPNILILSVIMQFIDIFFFSCIVSFNLSLKSITKKLKSLKIEYFKHIINLKAQHYNTKTYIFYLSEHIIYSSIDIKTWSRQILVFKLSTLYENEFNSVYIKWKCQSKCIFEFTLSFVCIILYV